MPEVPQRQSDQYQRDADVTDNEVAEPLLARASTTSSRDMRPTDSNKSSLAEIPSGYTDRHKFKKFGAYAVLGFLFIFIINLIFLPRTSLSRDLRRIHGTPLTSTEMKRIYLESLANENNAREYLKLYTFKPHLAGQSFDLVRFTEKKFKEFGLQTYIEKFDVWLNRPVDAGLQLLDINGNVAYKASLKEDPISVDETTTYNNSIPAFHGYSANGNVTLKFTFANYGMKEDFETLKLNGVVVNGTICIMRYEKIFRGLKVKHAEMYGCIGAVLYTDPFDDGLITVKNGYKLYPDGPARNPSSIQRGSVEYFTDFPGDPTTSGFGCKHDCKRESPEGKVPNIPSIPISSREIEPILKQLIGKGPQLGWGGDIDFDYSPGPSTLELNLLNVQDYKVTPIWNVVGEIKGILPDEEIIIGNHRDSWVLGGAGDPNSGSLSLLETIRGFSELLKLGYKPLRTLKFISLDGEEYAMLGSTEYGESHSKSIQKKTVAYLNLDTSVLGTHFQINSNPILNEMIYKVSKETPFVYDDPTYSLFKLWDKQNNATIAFPGSGTDYAVFQNHLGVPIINMQFGHDGEDPVYHYHSNYDSFYWMDNFGDPEYKYHNCMSKFMGLLILELSETEVLPLSTSYYSTSIKKYYHSMTNEIPKSWYNVHIEDSVFKDKSVMKSLLELDEAPTFKTLMTLFDDKLLSMIETTEQYDKYLEQLQEGMLQDFAWFKYYLKFKLAVQVKLANYKLSHLDRLFLDDEHLVNREWMLHTIFAPHRDLGYTGDVLPGFHEALMRSDFDDASKWLGILIKKFEAVQKYLS